MTGYRARLVFAAALAAATVVAGCSGDDDSALPGDPTTQDGSPLSTSTTEAPRLERRDAGFALPVTLVAGDAHFEVTTIEFSNATPGTYFDDEPELLEDDLLYVTFTAQLDAAAGADAAVAWPTKTFQIVTGTGRVVSGSGVDYATAVEATSAQPTTSAVVFPVRDNELSGARFRFDDGTTSAEVALMPPAPPTSEAPPDSDGSGSEPPPEG